MSKHQSISEANALYVSSPSMDEDTYYSPQRETTGFEQNKKNCFRSHQKLVKDHSPENEEIKKDSSMTEKNISDRLSSDEDEMDIEGEDHQVSLQRNLSQPQINLQRERSFEMTGTLMGKLGNIHSFQENKCDCSSLPLLAKNKILNIEVEEDCRLLKEGKWTKTKCMLMKDKLAFIEVFFWVSDIVKIKLFSVQKKCFDQTIKLQIGENFHFFSVDVRKKYHDLSLPFYMFSKLIMKKLAAMGADFSDSWEKTDHIEKGVTLDSYIYGKIYKKSQHFGIWSERFVVIKKQGIYSYKSWCKQENYSFFIDRQSVRYIWTRLDQLENLLIIKIKHGLTKTEFAIPINNYSCRGCKNWLYDFCRMLL